MATMVATLRVGYYQVQRGRQALDEDPMSTFFFQLGRLANTRFQR